MIYLLALLIGMVAGMRTMTAPTAVSWAAWLGYLNVRGTWLGFLAHAWTPWILTLLAIGELIVDKLPTTPSRKVPLGFGARVVSGALSGAAISTAGGETVGGMIAGIVGAVLGTLGGYDFRTRLAAVLRKDRPAALIEDAIAITTASLIVFMLR
jgi:uncharacterized membrane protein